MGRTGHSEYEAKAKERAERQRSFDAQLQQVRQTKRKLARDAQGNSDFTVRRILELTEALFGEDTASRSDASELLQQAAKIAPELFDSAAIDLILISASQPALADLCLPVAAGLSSRRTDLTERLVSVAVEAIDARLSVEIACEILVGCGCGTTRAIPAGVVQKVVTRQNHMRPIGGWPTRHPDCSLVDLPPLYAFSTCLLVRAYDQDPEAVLDGTPGLPGGKERLVSRGELDSPWGLAIAPSSFGTVANDLLVGNFKSGFIDIYNPATGKFLGQLKDPDGEPIHIDHLWALKVGNGSAGTDTNTIYFTAGLDNEQHGLFGSLTPVARGTPEGPAEAQAVVAALDVVQLDLATLISDINSRASPSTIAQDRQTLNTDFATLVQAEQLFAKDSGLDHTTAATPVHHEATRQDIDRVFASVWSMDGFWSMDG
jgi:hypothetical protein